MDKYSIGRAVAQNTTFPICKALMVSNAVHLFLSVISLLIINLKFFAVSLSPFKENCNFNLFIRPSYLVDIIIIY